MKYFALLVPLFAALSLSTVARAEETATAAPAIDDATRATARELATSASDSYRAGDFAAAYDGFNRAFRLVGVPALGVWSARSLEKLGRMVEASERYRDVLKLQVADGAPETYRTSQKDAEKELNDLLPRIPSLVLVIQITEGDGTTVSIDGRPMASALIGIKQKIDPGTHHLRAERGGEVLEYDVTLAEREGKEIELNFDSPQARVTEKSSTAPVPAAPQAKPESQGLTTTQTAGLITAGAGVVFLGAGTVLTFLALDKQSALEKSCTAEGACPTSSSGELNSFNTLAPLSTAGLIAGGVLGAAGIGLFLFGGEKPSEPSAMLYTGPSQVGVRGAF